MWKFNLFILFACFSAKFSSHLFHYQIVRWITRLEIQTLFPRSVFQFAAATSSSIEKRFSPRNRFVWEVDRKWTVCLFTYCHRNSDCAPLWEFSNEFNSFNYSPLSLSTFIVIHKMPPGCWQREANKLTLITTKVRKSTWLLIFNATSLFYAPIIILCAFLHAFHFFFEAQFSSLFTTNCSSRGNSMTSKCKLNSRVSFSTADNLCLRRLPFSLYFLLIHSTILVLWFCFTFFELSLPSAAPL